jgi:hypothetical protein
MKRSAMSRTRISDSFHSDLISRHTLLIVSVKFPIAGGWRIASTIYLTGINHEHN